MFELETEAHFLVTLGCMLLLGLLTSAIGRHTILPRVSLLLVFGVIVGNVLLDIMPMAFTNQFQLITDMALVMVGFLLGGKLTKDSLKGSVGNTLWISLTAAIVTALFVALALWLVGISINIAILLGCIASATAPTAIFDIIKESGYEGPFSNLLLSIVALDDAWALLLFAVGIAVITSLNGDSSDTHPLLTITREIGGAVVLGLVIGLPASYLTGRLKSGEPMLSEALGIVFLCGGLALALHVSFLIATMVMGCVIANLAKHHEYPFHEIEGIEWPFLVLFFVLAGASLDFSALTQIGLIGTVYIVSRGLGKYIGAMLGGYFSKAPERTRNWIGLALMPQAGVGIGLVLLASENFPQYEQVLLSVIISSTIFFDVIGPMLTRYTLKQAEDRLL